MPPRGAPRAEPDPARHPAHRPGEVHRGGARVDELLRRLAQPRRLRPAARLDGERVRGGDADRGGAAHGEVLDRLRDLVGGGELEPDLVGGQAALIEDADDIAPLVVQDRPERLRVHRFSLPSPAKSRRAKYTAASAAAAAGKRRSDASTAGHDGASRERDREEHPRRPAQRPRRRARRPTPPTSPFRRSREEQPAAASRNAAVHRVARPARDSTRPASS